MSSVGAGTQIEVVRQKMNGFEELRQRVLLSEHETMSESVTSLPLEEYKFNNCIDVKTVLY
jgi:hypothetical protein